MNLLNQRLREIQQEKHMYNKLLEQSESISDLLTYQGKLDLLEQEETEILKKNGVTVWVKYHIKQYFQKLE